MEKKWLMNNARLISFVFSFFLILLFSGNAFAEGKVNVLSFGATGNGEYDETEFIQKAIDFQSEGGGGVVVIPRGTYLINAESSIVLKNNITLEFEEGTVLKAIPNNLQLFQIIKIYNVENVKLIGKVKIQGERQNHLGTLGEWGMGISIRGSKNIEIENPIISDNWGDGIYIGSTSEQNYSENIRIVDPIIENNRRQGISVISVKNLEIINAVIKNTNGTKPEGGIDIEPNDSSEFSENVNIKNLSTEKNAGSGLLINTSKLKGSENPISIYVDSTKNIKDGYAVTGIDQLKGQINIGGYFYLSDKEILSKPIVNAITNSSTNLTGTAPLKSVINIKVGTTLIGTTKTSASGQFNAAIPEQKTGTILSVTATDYAGNVSEETIVTVGAEKFSDIKSTHWFYNEILYLTEKKIIEGFPNGSFQPNRNTTRAEAARMLTTSLNISSSTKKTDYSDISELHWAKNDIAAVTIAGLFDGYPDGTFRPDKKITRAEMAKVLTLAYNFQSSNSKVFEDVANHHWASYSISALSQNKITNGFPDGTFRPNSATTRAEFSVFLARALNKDFR